MEVRDLVVRYDDLVAVDGVSFDARAGEVTALLGPNGAGKTSTIETIEGYRSPDGGTVRMLGLDPVADHARVVPSLGVMLQEGGVYPGIRAREAVELFAAFYEDPHDPAELLERVGLSSRADATWRKLSGGEKQRLSLALALVGRPTVAVLDEPTAGLDVDGRRLVRDVVRDLRDTGAAVLLATHDLADAETQADRVVIVDHGRVVADGSLAEVLRGDGDVIRFGAPGGIDLASLGAALGASVRESSPGEYVVDAAPDPARVARLTSWLAEHDIALGDLQAGRLRLDDVFQRLTRGQR